LNTQQLRRLCVLCLLGLTAASSGDYPIVTETSSREVGTDEQSTDVDQSARGEKLTLTMRS
jgi:hypothetical protein